MTDLAEQRVAALTEDEVVASQACPNCRAKPGTRCQPRGVMYQGTEVHRGRWLAAARRIRKTKDAILAATPPR